LRRQVQPAIIAEGEGFEPSSPFGETVFKTATLNRSDNPLFNYFNELNAAETGFEPVVLFQVRFFSKEVP
jgi:hypothetical protein